MSFIPPRYVGGSAVGWELVDYLRVTRESDPATASGALAIELAPLADDELMLIDHVVTSCTSSTVTDLRYYDGSIALRNMIEQTDNGNLDVADWNGLQRSPGQPLTLVWTGVSVGARATLNLQARLLRRRS